MPKILITGNGFDLFHGLPTKYGHFMAIMETIEQYGFKEKISFEDLFGIRQVWIDQWDRAISSCAASCRGVAIVIVIKKK